MNRPINRLIAVCSVLLPLALVAPVTEAQAEGTKPVQFSLWAPAQWPDIDTNVSGLRLNLLYGVSNEVRGVSLGLVNRSTGTLKGLEFGGASIVDGDFSGFQWTYVYNKTAGVFVGWQSSLINLSGTFTGVATGGYNQADTGNGLQLGLVNNTKSFEGVQIALFNQTENMHGLQIGIINIIKNKEKLSLFPIVNWKF